MTRMVTEIATPMNVAGVKHIYMEKEHEKSDCHREVGSGKRWISSFLLHVNAKQYLSRFVFPGRVQIYTFTPAQYGNNDNHSLFPW
jgi:hypothetical protein